MFLLGLGIKKNFSVSRIVILVVIIWVKAKKNKKCMRTFCQLELIKKPLVGKVTSGIFLEIILRTTEILNIIINK